MGKTPVSSLRQQPDETVAEVSGTSGCPGAPKLDPRVRRTRKLLEDAMRGLLQERSYDEISVSDIAERATVNRATFYAHFLDKQDLAATMMREELEAALIASLPGRAAMNEERLVILAAAYFEFVGRTFGRCPKRGDEFAAHVGPTLQDGLQHFLQVWLEHEPEGLRLFRSGSKDAVITVLSWSLFGAARRWSHVRGRVSAEASAREIVSLLLR